LRWVFSPGSQVLEAVERGRVSACRIRLSSELVMGAAARQAAASLLGIPSFTPDGSGGVEWRVIDG
jgi:hypothetical protein